MATTFVDHDGDGNATKSFSFPSIKEADIKVEVDQVVKTVGTHYNITGYTTTGGGNVVFIDNSGSGGTNHIPQTSANKIRIFRDTDVDSAKATFTAGSSVRAGDLNNNQTQILYAAQEEQNQTIQTAKIKDLAVTTAKIKDQNVTTAKIADDAVTGAKLPDDVINSEHYAAVSIDTEHIANENITTAKLANSAVTSSKLADANVITAKIADSNVTTAKIADSNVTTAKIADSNVTTVKIADSNVTTAKIADSNVTTAKIADDAVTSAKLANDIDLAGTLDVSGQATFDNNVLIAADNKVFTVANGSSVNKFQVDTDNGNTTIQGGLNVQGGLTVVGSTILANEQIGTSELATDAVTTAKITDSNVTTDKIADSNVTTAKIADDAVTAAKIADSVIVTNSEQASASVNDTSFFTTSASDARYFNISSGDTIKDGDTFPDNDTTIATTAAINDRIIDLVDDVGGFVPIASETNFPAENPDINLSGSTKGGTIISVKTASTNLVPSGTTVNIPNGRGSGNAVVLTGVPSTIPSGFGFLVETTQVDHTYAFHRLVPKATEVTTVATNATNIAAAGANTTNINAVANNASNINTVAGNNANVSTVAGISANVTTVAGIQANVTTVANNNSNVTAVAGNNSNITAVAGNATNINAVQANASNINTVAGINSDVTAVAGNSSNINSAVSNASNINSAVSNASNINSAVSNATNINTVAGAITNVNTTATNISNVNTVASNISNVNSFAGTYQIASSAPSTDGAGNALAEGDLYFDTSSDELRIYNGSSWQGGVTAGSGFATSGANTFTGNQIIQNAAPSLSFVDSNNNPDFKILSDGGILAFQDISNSANRVVINADGHVDITGNLDAQGGLDVTGNITVSGNVDGRDVAADGTKLDGITANAIADLVEDTSPQLGGALESNGNEIRMADNNKFVLGDSQDLQIYHDSSNSYIKDSGTGALQIQASTLFLKNAAGNENMLQAHQNGAINLYYDNSKKLETTSAGATLTGDLSISQDLSVTRDVSVSRHVDLADDSQLRFGSPNGFNIYHDGSNTYMINQTGNLYIRDDSGNVHIQGRTNEESIIAKYDGAVELYYDNVKKFETTTAGVKLPDNQKVEFGDDDDLEIFHYQTDDENIINSHKPLLLMSNGNTRIQSNTGEDMIKAVPNGAVELYYNNTKTFETAGHGINITGGFVQTGSSLINDNGKLQFGNGADLQIYHDGTYNRIAANAQIFLQNKAANETYIAAYENGAVELYHDNNKKFETTSAGTTTTGTSTVNGFVESVGSGGNHGGKFGNISVGHGSTYNTIQTITNSTNLHLQYNVNGDIRCNEGGGDMHTRDILPQADSSYNLGSNGTRWANVYADTLYGNGSNLTGINTDLVSDTSPQLGGLLDGNGQTANFTANNTAIGIPIGTTAQRPTASSYKGYIRFNDTDDDVEYSDGTNWRKINSVIVNLNNTTGSIFAGLASSINLSGTGFLAANLVVNFTQTSDGIDTDVTVTPTSDTAATVAVPAAVYNNVTAGNAVSISVTNSDGVTSGTVNSTALSLPTGGTITTYSSGGTNYRVHSFTSSGTFTNTISSLTVTYLIVAGGGGGGSNNDVGGGGGAGGLLQGTSTPSVTGHTITVGAGGAGGCSGQGGGGGCRGSNGGNSSAFGITASGGGGGGTRYQSGRSGGSGGGGGDGGASGGSGTSGQGHSGGTAPGMDTNNMNDQGAGGGAGGAANSYNPGPGLNVSITGTSVEYARGGTGYNHPQVRQAPANSGDGGRGAYNQSGSLGGSGIVILRYAI